MAHRGLRILVVDEPGSQTIEQALESTDLDPVEERRASSMREAEDLLGSGGFDIILTDLALPDAHGLSTVNRIRAVAHDTPMIVFCDELDGPMAIQAVQVGAQDYLIKGKEGPEELTRSVRYCLSAKGAETSLAFLAQHDPVTQLVNRALFEDRLEHALVRAARHSSVLALFVIDLDGFAALNDRYGNDQGDAILEEAAARMRRHLRKMDTLARSHSDTFLLIAEDVRSPEGAGVVATKLLDCFEPPFEVGGDRIQITASIGFSIHPDDADDPSILMELSARALDAVKQRGGNGSQSSASI